MKIYLKHILTCIVCVIICHIFLNVWRMKFILKNEFDSLSDIETISQIAFDHDIFVYMLHLDVLKSLVDGNLDSGSWAYRPPILLGLDSRTLDSIDMKEFLKSLEAALFKTFTFYNAKPLVKTDIGENCPIGIIIWRNIILYLIVLYSREDVWWFGSLKSDDNFYIKSHLFNFSNQDILRTLTQEGTLDKFEGLPIKMNGICRNLIYPKKISKFIREFKNTRFLECNTTRARIFNNMYRSDSSVDAKRFKHRSRKLLSKTKVILDNLSVPFWLSSGTCLGYFRECDIISYSQDVDIGIFVQDFNYKIITDFIAHNFHLKHWFGAPEDSLELSFFELSSGLKLDIFFFYTEGGTFWNGGTQVKTGKKFKYVFNKFDLCWTLFLGIKVRIPCNTENYITANYGPNWTMPIKKWDWKSSPPNVKNNGIWPKNKWPSVIRSW